MNENFIPTEAIIEVVSESCGNVPLVIFSRMFNNAIDEFESNYIYTEDPEYEENDFVYIGLCS